MACGAIFFLHICLYLSVFRILIFVGVRAYSGVKRLNVCRIHPQAVSLQVASLVREEGSLHFSCAVQSV